MANKRVTDVGLPFRSESKQTWIFHYYVEIDGEEKRLSKKRKSHDAIDEEYQRLKDQIALTGNSGTYDFRTIARFRDLEQLAAKVGVDPDEAIKEAIKRLSNSIVDIKVQDAWEIFKETDFKAFFEKSTQSTNRSTFRKFCSAFGEHQIGKIGREEVLTFARTLKATVSRSSTKREMAALSGFFDWCSEEDPDGKHENSRPFIRENPFGYWSIEKFWKVTNEEKANEKQPEINTPEDIERIILTTLETDPLLLPAVILKNFAFLRTCELLRIKPNAIDIRKRIIELGANVAKKGKNGTPKPRTIEGLCDAFQILMAPFTNEAGKLKILDIKNYERRIAKIYKLALGDESAKLNNEFRHNCASFEYAKTKDLTRIAFKMGHQSTVSWKHYINTTVTEQQANGYFAIRPPVNYAERIAAFQTKKAKSAPKWPTDTNLRKLVQRMPLTKIAETVGVSEAAVRKRLKKLDIQAPTKGYWQKLKALQDKEKKQTAKNHVSRRKAG